MASGECSSGWDSKTAEDSYAFNLWPCSPILAQYVWEHRDSFKDKIVLELGSGGTGVPGIAAAKCGAKRVIFTDRADRNEALQFCRKNCIENGLDATKFEIAGLNWGSKEQVTSVWERLGPIDWILASDCFYDPSTFDPLCRTYRHFLNCCSKIHCLFAYQERNSDWTVEPNLRRHNLECRRVVDGEFQHKECVRVPGFDDEMRSHTVHLAFIMDAA